MWIAARARCWPLCRLELRISKIPARHHFEVRPILLVKDVGMMPQSFL
jgi:hypothetical protein